MYHIQNPSFHLFVLCVCPFTYCPGNQPKHVCVHAELQPCSPYSCSVVWQCCSSETAAFWLLCDITCCCHCNNLIMPSKLCMSQLIDETGLVSVRAERLCGDPGPLCVLGLHRWWTTLQSTVACHGGGGASTHLPLHRLALMNVKLIKTHYYAQIKGKPSDYLSNSWCLFGGNNLITGSVKRSDHRPYSNLHINEALHAASNVYGRMRLRRLFLITVTLCCSGGEGYVLVTLLWRQQNAASGWKPLNACLLKRYVPSFPTDVWWNSYSLCKVKKTNHTNTNLT